MPLPALIVSRDPALRSRLTEVLPHEIDATVLSVTDPVALPPRDGHGPVLLFVDVRPHGAFELTHPLWDALRQNELSPAAVVLIGDGFYPRPLAELCDLLAFAHLPTEFTAEQGRAVLGELSNRLAVEELPVVPPSRIIEAEDRRLVTHTPALFPVLDQLARVAPHDVTMLLVGETGTGKTTLAQLIHRLSPRKDRPFHTVACGALPRDLIESELFGHVRGAFTGADRSKIGRFEAAGRGTLLLDEIDVLGPREQTKLLKVIETGEFELVGSTETRVSQARLIVASNVDLETLTREMRFRSDLFYRLNVLEFRLPPLRERPLDIVPMALHFVEECSARHAIPIERIHRDFLAALKAYHWPGNIRELKNQIQRAVLFSENGELRMADLTPAVLQAPPRRTYRADGTHQWSLGDRVAVSERVIIEEALRANGFKRTATAKALGISRVGLYKKMRKYGMLELDGRVG